MSTLVYEPYWTPCINSFNGAELWNLILTITYMTWLDHADFEKLVLKTEQILDSYDYAVKVLRIIKDVATRLEVYDLEYLSAIMKKWLVKFCTKRAPQNTSMNGYRY